MSKLYGINLAGAEFAPETIGTLGREYAFPTAENFAYWSASGIRYVRLPILWERLQSGPLWHLRCYELHRGLYATLDIADRFGVKCIIDVHNYGRFFGKPLTAQQSDIDIYRDFIGKLVEATDPHPAVYGYEIMNEPHDLPGDPNTTWLLNAEAAEQARARTGKLIILPLPGWQNGRFANDQRIGYVWPIGSNFVLGVHVYGDGSYQGVYGLPFDMDLDSAWPYGPLKASTMADRLQETINFCETLGISMLVTECGVPTDAPWLAMFKAFLEKVDTTDCVLGAFAWAGGPRWPDDYRLNLEPSHGIDKPQTRILMTYA